MARLGRPGMSDERKNELWERWRAGESVSEVSRVMNKPAGVGVHDPAREGRRVFASTRRRASHLTLEERERSRAGSPGVSRSARSPGGWGGRCRRSRGRSLGKGLLEESAIDAHESITGK